MLYSRLKTALRFKDQTRYFIVLSRGTTHRLPPETSAGRAIDEAAASAKFLVEHGVQPEMILLESWSLDTIGNAYATCLMHLAPLGLARIMVVTNPFHMKRTKAIFEFVSTLTLPYPVLFSWEAADESMIPQKVRAYYPLRCHNHSDIED